MFKVGREYKRKEIHENYGGQGQGGISTPKNKNFIILFTSDSGARHGYYDEYRDDGVFWYTGEGQTGDMKMVSGNKAILEHSKSGKDIHIFESTRKAYVRYIGKAEYLGHHKEVRPDREGDLREVIVFHLDVDSIDGVDGVAEPAPNYGKKEVDSLKNKSLRELRVAALDKPSKNVSHKEKMEIAYYRSQAIRKYIIARSNGICEGCRERAPFDTKDGPFLECHHLHRLADGGPDHPENVVALCPNCHRRAHFARDAKAYNEILKDVVVEIEKGALYGGSPFR